MRIFVIFVFTLLCSKVLAQKTYTGMVVDSVSMAALPNVHITVKHSDKGTYTNASGIFTLSLNVTDTLLFTSLGYEPQELALFLEEDVLFIRLREQVSMLQEITIKATRLYPNQIADRTHSAPRKMDPYQALQSPFTYFSKTEKEKRKIYRYVEESNKTQTYVQVITDPVVKEIFTKDYNLGDEEYYDRLAIFNQQYRSIQYATDPEVIMEALHSYFSKTK